MIQQVHIDWRDPRVDCPPLLKYEYLEIECAINFWNQIASRHLSIHKKLDLREGKAIAVICDQLRDVRAGAVAFGAARMQQLVKEASTLAGARKAIAKYLHGKGLQDHE